MTTRAMRAAELRDAHNYNGTLTVPLLVALQALLEDPTPKRYVRRIPATLGKDYESTGLTGIQYQIDYMNAVFTLAHWRPLVTYTDDGTVAHAYVVIGNNLAGIRIDADGELVVPEEAEVLVERDGWGGHIPEARMGDRLKSGRTNALKRVLAEIGVAADVYRLDVEAGELLQVPEHLLATTNNGSKNGAAKRRPASGQGHAASTNGATPVASKAQLEMLRRHADRQGLTATAFANLLRAAHKFDPTTYETEAAAQEVLDRQLPKLPRDLVQPLLSLIKSSAAADRVSGNLTGSPATQNPPPSPAPHTPAPAPPAQPPQAAEEPPVAGAAAGKAQLLAQHARAHGLTSTALVALLDQVQGRPVRTFATAAEAVAAVAAELPALADDLVVPLASLIAAAGDAPFASTPQAATAEGDVVPFDPTAAQAA